MLPNGVMTAEDVANYLNLGKNKVYQMAKDGEIASYHVGRKLRFTIEDVEAYVASTRRVPNETVSMEAGDADEGPEQSMVDAASFGVLGGRPFSVAGGDAVSDIVTGTLNERGIPTRRLVRGSYTALVNLYAGEADAAVVCLYDQKTNSYNVPYVRSLAPGASVVVIRLYGRMHGLIVQKGNPKKLATWGSLLRDGVRLSNQAKGSAERVLLDEKLRSLEARSESIEGYDAVAPVASAAVGRVESGIADVAIGGNRDIAWRNGVELVPLQMAWVDIVVAKNDSTRPVIRELKKILPSSEFADQCMSLQMNDASKLGTVIYES